MNRILAGHGRINLPSHNTTDQRPDDDGTTGTRYRGTNGNSGGPGAEETCVGVRGVIRSDAVHLLPPCGTAYGLFDEQTAGYDCALKSDIYQLEDWVGDYVQVTGPLTGGNEMLPVMRVIRLQLLTTKWMR